MARGIGSEQPRTVDTGLKMYSKLSQSHVVHSRVHSSLHSILLYGDDYVPLPWATSSSFHNSHQTRPCPPRQ
ncbi:hypothetical protein J6590_090520 [Homalodisca vitripennis]|nr:hypothetical protein J6590_090520 [Homalodisca vitripennis]